MVIIVGATGFIGHYTTKYFVEKGIKVLATGRSEQNSKLIRDMGADFIEFDMTKEEEKQILVDFASRVKQRRESLDISQEKLAGIAGLHRTYIGSLERAEKIPSLITIVKITKALQINISDLIII